jgi:curved DNA-binding protein CbpA
MVKLDVRRDYYADLHLTPSADAEDVKKQFRKLGEKEKENQESVSDVG